MEFPCYVWEASQTVRTTDSLVRAEGTALSSNGSLIDWCRPFVVEAVDAEPDDLSTAASRY